MLPSVAVAMLLPAMVLAQPVNLDASAAAGTDGSAGHCSAPGGCWSNGSGNGHEAPTTPTAGSLVQEYPSGWNLQGDAANPAVTLTANGGKGGKGGDAASSVATEWQNGGAGADGSSGGALSVEFQPGASATTSGPTSTLRLTANGGDGGGGGMPANYGKSGQGGRGGDGGTIVLKANGSIVNAAPYSGTQLAPAAVVLVANGGNGASGDNYSAKTSEDTAHGPDGGAGGTGGNITFSAFDDSGRPSITSNGAGVIASTVGGNGSYGAEANTTAGDGRHAKGGAGGAGGRGGIVLINTGNATLSVRGVQGHSTGETYVIDPRSPDVQAALSFTSGAVIAQSFGGDGGEGGDADGNADPANGGAGGAAGAGGSVSVYTAGTLTSQDYGTAGIVAQSVGGSGGNGNTAGSIYKAKAGNGGLGGDGGTVTVAADDYAGNTGPSALISTLGDDANAIMAQSIGGGGGNGGSVSVSGSLTTLFSVAVGGDGEAGGKGSTVRVSLGSVDPQTGAVTSGASISTKGARSAGVLAQSVGGGGGSGGSASALTAGGVLSLAIGGTGGSGGTAGTAADSWQQVQVDNYGSIWTDGEHSAGILAQAIGGGGGNGGAAHSLDIGAQITNAVAIGGDGGSGGTAGNVSVNHHGQVVTEQGDSYGVLAQSIGGGGGNGGASFAETLNAFNSPDFPSVNMKTAVGGKGVSGGDAGNVTVDSDGVVLTRGAGSIGLFGQSIGGGGGNGGDSTAIGVATFNSTVDLSVAVGGSGGAGGLGGAVNLTNDAGSVMTFGTGAIGMFGQSIGGGGGNGGSSSIDTASFLSENEGVTTTVAIGGNGGSGNLGGDVTVNNLNWGSVTTNGDGAIGLGAQSIGGSGGIGGASAAGGSGGNIVVNVSLGGDGGSGNHGGKVTVQNDGSILTFGGKADGVFAQSVGGSGGSTIDKSTSGGGTDPEVRAADYLAGGLGIGSNVIDKGNGLYDIVKDEIIGDKAIDALRDAFTNYVTNNPEPGEAGADQESSWTVTVDVGATISGQGGSGGDGGLVTVNNTGVIETHGPNAAGIFAQSVGGSGGSASAAKAENNPQGLASTNIPLSGSVAIGGGGGSSGKGGDIDVTSNGVITTYGDAANAISAQSIGGGGGSGGMTLGDPTRIQVFNVSLGGSGGANGVGGHVTVNTGAQSSLDTSGVSSHGVVAQSIGGGGGTATLMRSQNSTLGGTYQSAVDWSPVVTTTVGGSDTHSDCGGTGAAAVSCGNGGQVDVAVSSIRTRGAGSHAVVAQSIGGGGGMLVGAVAQDTAQAPLFGTGAMVGDGQTVNVTVNAGTMVSTQGDGSYGVIAQSIGGGGLLATRPSSGTGGIAAFQQNGSLSGNGGEVNVNVGGGALVTTSGTGSHGIFAQSVGGGGGLAMDADSVLMGTAGGSGISYPIYVNVDGKVQTTGTNAAAVFINPDGQYGSNNEAVLTVGANGVLSSAGDLGTVVFRGLANTDTSNKIHNYGTIEATQAGGNAVYSYGGATLNLDNYGWIIGNVKLGWGTFSILENGGWTPGDYSYAAQFVNNVEIDMYGSHLLEGDLVNNNLLYSNVDFAAGTGGVAHVTGTATMNPGSRIMIEPKTLTATPFTVLKADGALQLNAVPTVVGRNAGQFTFGLDVQDNSIAVTPQANIAATAQRFSASPATVNLAQHLDAGFTRNVGSEMAQHYATLAKVQDGDELTSVLGQLGNEGVQAASISHLTRSHDFVGRMSSCPQFGENGAGSSEGSCTWGRIIGNESRRDPSSSSNGYKTEDYTVQFGSQMRLRDDWFLGGSVSADRTRARDSAGSASVKGRGFTVGAVLKRQFGDWMVSGAVDAGIADYDAERRIRLPEFDRTAEGSFKGRHVGVHARVARQIPFDTWYLKPYLDLHATRMRTDGYEETGAGALNLRVSKASDTLLAASPMLEIGHRMRLGNGLQLHTYASAGMTAYNDSSWGADAQLIGAVAEAGTFRTVSSAPSTRAKLNLGANLITRRNFDLRLEYSGEFASGYRSHNGSLKLNYMY
ncbi:autotransporter outer membrane beta-barrel domain-containing protein [Verticiella sediminum]|uniref:Autotransporter outer membrane beta-barrel domain-containing protein n=1 Tax=Verticiella sediminum TaxID=1247510 RepID=A0A556ABT9_9BURK|nr:autotransporter outer membrane beta-barrel domain-containing protein [Verticiella sediminum]TSH90348.1 autotransporter outer membrane beta-barrel domain-containing protein [Verticiella sediminum]